MGAGAAAQSGAALTTRSVINTGILSGSITVDSVDACRIVGSDDVTLLKGGPLKGTFRVADLPDSRS